MVSANKSEARQGRLRWGIFPSWRRWTSDPSDGAMRPPEKKTTLLIDRGGDPTHLWAVTCPMALLTRAALIGSCDMRARLRQIPHLQ